MLGATAPPALVRERRHGFGNGAPNGHLALLPPDLQHRRGIQEIGLGGAGGCRKKLLTGSAAVQQDRHQALLLGVHRPGALRPEAAIRRR
jgi:hypothetical protein